jgi:glutamate-1-semialdehyde 2,1-aminomutase
MLIFDEVISGFRVGFEGAAGYYQIQPDIITYGKIIGGGLPVGAYGASAEVMDHISPDGAFTRQVPYRATRLLWQQVLRS